MIQFLDWPCAPVIPPEIDPQYCADAQMLGQSRARKPENIAVIHARCGNLGNLA